MLARVFVTLWSLWRRLTDRLVYCQKCGEPIGFMTIRGPKKWEHVECPSYAPVRVAMEQ